MGAEAGCWAEATAARCRAALRANRNARRKKRGRTEKFGMANTMPHWIRLVDGWFAGGLATSRDSASPGDLIRHADLALYAAKAAGKRQWRRYQPVLSAGMKRRRELQAALDVAVAESAFTLRSEEHTSELQ